MITSSIGPAQTIIAKTKEIVFHRSSARHNVIPSPIANIEQVDCVKLLGVYFSDNLPFCSHANHLPTALNHRFYLLSQLHCQGLVMHGLQTEFKSIILSKIIYACQSFLAFYLSATMTGSNLVWTRLTNVVLPNQPLY